MTNRNKKTNRTSLFNSPIIVIGGVLILISPLVFSLVPTYLKNLFCNPGPIANGCGENDLGILGYALWVSLTPFIIGFALLITGIVLHSRNR